MPRPKRTAEQAWFEAFEALSAPERILALKVLEQIHKFLLKHEAQPKKEAATG